MKTQSVIFIYFMFLLVFWPLRWKQLLFPVDKIKISKIYLLIPVRTTVCKKIFKQNYIYDYGKKLINLVECK